MTQASVKGQECVGALIELGEVYLYFAKQGGTADAKHLSLEFPRMNAFFDCIKTFLYKSHNKIIFKGELIMGTKKLIKKVVVVLMIAVLIVVNMVSCSTEKDDGKLTIGIVQLVENGAFEDMKKGFINRLKELGYDEDKVIIKEKNAQGDMVNLNTICQEMVNSKVDLVAAIATPPAQAMVSLESDIPVIFISISDPIDAGLITDMKKPDKNATGTGNDIPIEKTFEMADEVTPNIKTYGLLYTTSEANSVVTIEETKKYLKSRGLKYKEATVTNSSEVQQATQSLVGKVDAIFVPNDSVIQSAMPQVSQIANETKIPLYGSSPVMVRDGALAMVGTSDEQVGAISGEMAVKYFEGTPIEEIEAIMVDDFKTVVNEETAKILGVDISKLNKLDIPEISIIGK